jgi:hypothetical protein
MVAVLPVPVVVIPPGELVIVHIPVDGKPFKTTLPVVTLQVGWVIIPGIGAEGTDGRAFITMFADATEVQPARDTVNVYVPGPIPETVAVVPVPVVRTLPGERVRVQVPAAGNPFNTTLPVVTEQVGWVITPADGAVGIVPTERE